MTPAQEQTYLDNYRRAIALLDKLTPEDMLNAFVMSAMSRPDKFTMKDDTDNRPGVLDVISFMSEANESDGKRNRLTITVTDEALSGNQIVQSDSPAELINPDEYHIACVTQVNGDGTETILFNKS